MSEMKYDNNNDIDIDIDIEKEKGVKGFFSAAKLGFAGAGVIFIALAIGMAIGKSGVSEIVNGIYPFVVASVLCVSAVAYSATIEKIEAKKIKTVQQVREEAEEQERLAKIEEAKHRVIDRVSGASTEKERMIKQYQFNNRFNVDKENKAKSIKKAKYNVNDINKDDEKEL